MGVCDLRFHEVLQTTIIRQITKKREKKTKNIYITYTHTLMYICTHTHTHLCIYVHTHTHTLKIILSNRKHDTPEQTFKKIQLYRAE